MHHIAKVHVIFQVSFEGDFYGLGDRHGRFTGCEGEGNGAGIRTKGYTFGHTGVRISTNDNGPVVDSKIVQDLMDDIGHCMVFTIGIASGDQSEILHEAHKLGNIYLSFLIPDRRSVTA